MYIILEPYSTSKYSGNYSAEMRITKNLPKYYSAPRDVVQASYCG